MNGRTPRKKTDAMYLCHCMSHKSTDTDTNYHNYIRFDKLCLFSPCLF